MFEDIICEPLVTSDRKTSFRSRKSWDSVRLSDSKRIVSLMFSFLIPSEGHASTVLRLGLKLISDTHQSFDSAFDAAKGALDKMRPTKSSYSKISGEPKQLIGVNW